MDCTGLPPSVENALAPRSEHRDRTCRRIRALGNADHLAPTVLIHIGATQRHHDVAGGVSRGVDKAPAVDIVQEHLEAPQHRGIAVRGDLVPIVSRNAATANGNAGAAVPF